MQDASPSHDSRRYISSRTNNNNDPSPRSPRRTHQPHNTNGNGHHHQQHHADSHRVHFGGNHVSERDNELAQSTFSHLFGLITGIVAFFCVLGLLTLLFILYFTVRPFSVSVYRRLSAQLGLACFLDALVLLLPAIKIHLTGDSDVPSPIGTSVVVSNHLCDADWWIIFMLGRSVGLQGTMKAFLRNEYLRVNVESTHHASDSPTSSSASARRPSSTMTPSALLPAAGVATTTSAISQPPPRNQACAPPDLSLTARLLHLLLDFPLVNGDEYIADREYLFRLLRSFAAQGGTGAPAHFLSFPEAWCMHNGMSHQSTLAKSNEFAQREGRPQLKHLLLPRTRGFNAILECLRESNPVVYDVTMVYAGYDGSLPPSEPLSLTSLWDILRRKLPSDFYVRVKRYSLEEVLQDPSWLDKKWQEKDRLLSHFARHGSFPSDGRGYSRHRVFDTWSHSLESSLVALSRLLILPCVVPILIFLSIPILWILLCIWILSSIMQWLFPGFDVEQATLSGMYENSDGNLQSRTPGSEGSGNAAGTPFCPATPFASPTANWFSKRD